jgi:hypothetical protein
MEQEKARALSSLITMMLRSGYGLSGDFDNKELASYIHDAGVALHNIPLNIAKGHPLYVEQLYQINKLDPSSKNNEWGSWVKSLVPHLCPVLPQYDKETEDRA